MLRRKRIPTDLDVPFQAFLAQAERVEQARRALLSCLPVGRVEPAPVPVGLDLLADELEAVRAELAAWRVPDVDDAWRACSASLDEALAAVAPAQQVATSTSELEELLGAVADVVEPLDVWGDAERRWRRLRR